MKKICVCTAVLLMTLTVSAYAASVSVCVFQNDGIGKNVQNASRVFESMILDYFFDSGCIVSSEPVSFEQEKNVAYQLALDSSAKGYIEYLVFYQLNIDPILLSAVSAEWKLVDVRENKTMGTGFIEAEKNSTAAEAEKKNRAFSTGAAAPVMRLLSGK